MGDEAVLNKVLRGDLEDLPPYNKQMVRIFTSSTFTDTYAERNILMRKIYPKLKEYCKNKFGLDFQTFLGQRYGSKPFPAAIKDTEMEHLHKGLVETQQAAHLDTLNTWYKKDTNAIPPSYLLQPISSKIPNFISETDDKRMKARTEWGDTSEKLREALTTASEVSLKLGYISEKDREKYIMSVTEEEIHCGIIDEESANDHCLCIVRNIEDILDNLDHKLAWRFIDTRSDGEVDEQAQTRLKELRDSKVINVLNRLNVSRYAVKWSEDGGVSGNYHSEYLEEMAGKFYDNIVFLIDKAMMGERALRNNPIYMEAIQHMRLASERLSLFHGREDLLEKVKSYVTGTHSSRGKFVVVHGSSGCGKTSLMAIISHKIRGWIDNGPKASVISRYLGTTPKSTNVARALDSISRQIAQQYNKQYRIPADFHEAKLQFAEMLVCGREDRPLVVLLDSLDQLAPTNYAHKLGWLPRTVPKHCYLIVSTLPEHFDILNSLRTRTASSDFIEVQHLGDELSSEILHNWLNNTGRAITPQQQSVVSAAFRRCSLPLYVKLIFDQVALWKSYETPDASVLKHSVREVITHLFSRVEKKHGGTLVRRTLGYISASRGGLSESELEDLLSLDDEVLTDVFQYHIPPTRRLPSSLWVRIKHDIQSYLSTREMEETTVIYWYHRQFIEAARARYLSEGEAQIQANMAEYYLGVWHGREKPFTYSESHVKKYKLSSSHGKEDRYVVAQPLLYSTDEKNKKFNLRKLGNLPFHLAKSGNMIELKKQCLFDYEWLHTKLQAVTIQALLDDLLFAPDDDLQIALLKNALNLSKSTLAENYNTLAVEMIGRLKSYQGKEFQHIEELVSQCYQNGPKVNALLPQQQCYFTGTSGQKYILEHPEHPPPQQNRAVLASKSKALYVLIDKNTLLKWDLEQGEIEKEIPMVSNESGIKYNTIGTSADCRTIVVGAAFQKETNPVLVVDVQQGEVTAELQLSKIYHNVGFIEDYKLFPMDDKLLVIAIGKSVDQFNMRDGQLSGSLDIIPGKLAISVEKKMGLISERNGNQINVCDFSTLNIMSSFELRDNPVQMVLHQDCKAAVAMYKKSSSFSFISFKDGKVDKIVDVPTKTDGVIFEVSISPELTYILVTMDKTCEIFSVKSLTHLKTFQIPASAILWRQRVLEYCALITNDESKLVVAYDQHLIVWNLKTSQLTQYEDMLRKIHRIQLTDDSEHGIISYTRNRMLMVWDLTGKITVSHKPLSLPSGCRYVVTSPHSETVIVRGTSADDISALSVKEGRFTAKPPVELETTVPLLNGNGTVYALRDPGMPGGSDISTSCLVLIKASDGSVLRCIPVSSVLIKTSAFTRDGQYIITSEESNPTEDFSLKVWPINAEDEGRMLPSPKGGVGYMFTADNDTVLVAQHQYPIMDEGRHSLIFAYDLITYSELYQLEDTLKESLHVTPDGSQILYVKTGKTPAEDRLMMQDVRSPSPARVMRSLPSGRFEFSADMTRAVDTRISTYDLVADRRLATFADPEEDMMEKQWNIWPKITKDGRYVIYTRLRKAIVEVGCVETGVVLGRCFTHAIPLSIQLSHDTILIGVDDGRVMILHIVDGRNCDAEYENKLRYVTKFNPKQFGITGQNAISGGNGLNTTHSSCCSIL